MNRVNWPEHCDRLVMVERVYHFGHGIHHWCEMQFVCRVCGVFGSFADFAGPGRGLGFDLHGDGYREYRRPRAAVTWRGRLRVA